MYERDMDDGRPTFHRKLAFQISAEVELYEKLKAYQWNASTEIDWTRPIRNFSEEAYASVARQLSREATASPFGAVNEFLAETFADIQHRLQRIGLELR